MSLIRKATERRGDGGGESAGPGMREAGRPGPEPGPEPSASPTPQAEIGEEPPPTFAVDFRRLAPQGFVTPRTLASPLAREVGAAKRRLIRRLGFFGRDRRVADASSPAPGAGNMVLVTSAGAGEGKTFLAANLALSLALEEKVGVTLVDADLAAPRLAGLFRLYPEGGGLSRALLATGSAPPDLDRLLHHAEGLPLAVLPAGPRPEAPAKLLSGPGMASLARELATRHADRLVVLDGPPVLATNEASILAQYVDQIVFVVEAGSSTPAAVSAALELLDSDDKVSLLLNRSTVRQDSHAHSPPYYGPSGSA